MAHIITRRGALGIGAGALATAAAGGDAAAQRIPTANAEMPRLPVESGARV